MMGISELATIMRREDYDISRLTHRDTMDAIGSVLAYIEGQWYTTEYGVNDSTWYRGARVFIEEHYARVAKEERCYENSQV